MEPTKPTQAPLLKPPSRSVPNLFNRDERKQISNNYAWNKGNEDALLNGDPSSTQDRAETYAQDPSITDALVEHLHTTYSNEHLDYGVLEGVRGMEPDQQIARITQEVNRLDANKLTSKQHLMIHMMRSGYGNLPATVAEEAWLSLSVDELQALGDNMRSQQLEELRAERDRITAPLGTDFTATVGVKEVLQQDFIPVYGAVTRVLTTRDFLPENLEVGAIRGLLPGEIRNDIREWFANADHTERLEYIRDIGETVIKLRQGPHAKHFTRYGILENIIGIFTEPLLEDNISEDSLDRWMGNLDVLLEAVYGVAVIAKTGSTLTSLFRTGDAVSARQAARAAGNTAAMAGVDNQIRKAAETFDLNKAEASVVDLPRPPSMRDDMDVLPDYVQRYYNETDAIRANVLYNTDDLTGMGLAQIDKDNAVARAIQELSFGDSVHVNHRMVNVEGLPNDTGVRITAVVGATPSGGWKNFDHLVDELLDLDPNLEIFEIVRRGANGKIEPLGVTPQELARFATKGELPVTVETGLAPDSATSRLFGGRRLSAVPKEELLKKANEVPDIPQQDVKNILTELDRRNTGPVNSKDPLKAIDGDEYYLRYSEDRFWHTLDKDGFNEGSFLSTGAFPRPLVAPNGKFGDDIYESFHKVYAKEQTLLRDFDNIYRPFRELPAEDKIVVNNIFEWAEDFAKQQADTGIARAPTYNELLTHFDGITPKQLQGYAAVREGLDLQWELFNRRLYRDMHSRGLKTMRPVSNHELPNYHGIEDANAKPGTYFDPIKNELVELDKTDILDIYNGGGSFMRLDFPVNAPRGGKYDRVLVRSGDYQLGKLSHKPLNYYEGYHMRFYQDPVYIVKHTRGEKINGKVIDEEVTEAIRTAGSSPEARQFINKYGDKQVDGKGRYVDRKNPNISYEIKPAKDINNVEGSLFQQQALHREGRLFWDKRNLERLPDTNGSRAQLQDLAQALEKGTAMAMRQVTHEDLFTTLKTAFGREYGDLIPAQDLATKDIRTIISELRAMRLSSTTPELRKRVNDALEMAKYLRIQMGTDSRVIPYIREATIAVANWVSNLGVRTDIKTLKRFGGWAERRGQSVDPFRWARSVAFHSFMVFRPVRQFLLQSAQISYLTAIDPTYITTGRVFKDSFALRRGIKKMTTANYTDGWNDTAFAKSMGLSKKEYKRVVEEFHRSGLLETVDVHSFNPSANRAKGVPLHDNPVGRGYYKFRGATQRVKQIFQGGFDLGERNNVTFTYMLAVRRALKEKGYKSLTQLDRKEWDKVGIDASNLALAMTRPNKFGYQSGMTGMVTQFLSFGHKAALGMLGQNPALKGQGLKIALTTYTLFGANMFGAEDWAREQLAQMGLSGKANREVLPGITLQDLMAAGIVESGLNAILRATTETQKELDYSFLAPGANVRQIYESIYEALSEAPEEGFLGPFHNPASGFLKGANFAHTLVVHSDRPPAEKFLKASDALLRNTLPGYNDANRAILAAQMGEWLDKDGDKMDLRPALNTILARGLLGVRSEEEMAYYRLRDLQYDNAENIRNAVEVNKAFLKELLTGWRGKKYSDEHIYEQVAVLSSLYESWPEGLRREIYVQSLMKGDPENPSIVEILGEMADSGTAVFDKMAPWIEAQVDMTPEEKQMLLDFTKDVQKGYIQSDAEYGKMLRQPRNID